MKPGSAILMDHYRHPRMKGTIQQPDARHEVHNRKCGDRLFFTATLENHTLKDIRFEGEGCFYCLASASILCCTVSGCAIDAALHLIVEFRDWLAHPEAQKKPPENKEMVALGEIRDFPMRIGCADLAWKGVEEMLRK